MKIQRQLCWFVFGFASCLAFMSLIIAFFVQGINHQPKVRIGMSTHEFLDVVRAEEASAKHRWLPPYRTFMVMGNHDSAIFDTRYYLRKDHEFLVRKEGFNFTNSTLISSFPISSEWHWDF